MIDAPIQFLFWETDEMIPFILIMYVFGLILKQWWAPVLAIAVHHFVVRRKSRANRGFMLHWAYWIGWPLGIKLRPVAPRTRYFGV